MILSEESLEAISVDFGNSAKILDMMTQVKYLPKPSLESLKESFKSNLSVKLKAITQRNMN